MTEADRTTLADYLTALSPEEWATPSLCADWTVEQVDAHMPVIPTVSKGKIFLNFAGSGFNLDKFSARMVGRLTSELSTDAIVESMRASAGSRQVPPGLKPIGVLAEVLVHGGDISRGVRRPLEFPTDHYAAALDYLKDVQPALGCKKRIAGLELRATDSDWSTGEGPLVEGSRRCEAAERPRPVRGHGRRLAGQSPSRWTRSNEQAGRQPAT
jgi:uncharacterized protein (TIGR03083 family)